MSLFVCNLLPFRGNVRSYAAGFGIGYFYLSLRRSLHKSKGNPINTSASFFVVVTGVRNSKSQDKLHYKTSSNGSTAFSFVDRQSAGRPVGRAASAAASPRPSFSSAPVASFAARSRARCDAACQSTVR